MIDETLNKKFEELVDEIYNLKVEDKQTSQLESEIDSMLANIYSLSTSEATLIAAGERVVESNDFSIRERSELVNS